MEDELIAIRKKLDEHEKRLAALEGLAKEEPKLGAKQLSVKEFILQKRPPNDVEKTLVVAYYLEHQRGVSPFNLNDLKTFFKKAKELMPENLNDKLNQNIAKGYMEEAEEKKDGKKAWSLTDTGVRHVENDLGKEEQKED